MSGLNATARGSRRGRDEAFDVGCELYSDALIYGDEAAVEGLHWLELQRLRREFVSNLQAVAEGASAETLLREVCGLSDTIVGAAALWLRAYCRAHVDQLSDPVDATTPAARAAAMCSYAGPAGTSEEAEARVAR